MTAEAISVERKKLGLRRGAWQQARLFMRLMVDKRVSVLLKVIPVAIGAYILMPFDISPDIVPVLGQLDDLGVFIVGIKMFMDMSPVSVVKEHMMAIREADGYDYLNEDVTDGTPLVIDGEIVKEKSPDDIA